MREKCKLLKGNSITNLLSKDPPVVSLGRGILYMSKMKKEFKEASALWGFPCIYYIGCRNEPMEYQFIQFCPLCGEKLV